MKKFLLTTSAILVLTTMSYAETKEFTLTLKDHVFSPKELKVPAGERVKLIVKNEDTTPAEFESHSLKREKIIPGGSQAVIMLAPLKKGEYKFFDEFHEKTTKGVLIAE